MLSLKLNSPAWTTVYTIPKGVILQKGRHGLYHEITAAAGNVKQACGCYAWADEDDRIRYCGSFSEYQRPEFTSSLNGRIHNYLQNHRKTANTGRKNTNLMVFDQINDLLSEKDVTLQHLAFESLVVGSKEVSFDDYSNDQTLVRAVESLVIATYSQKGQCDWNRT